MRSQGTSTWSSTVTGSIVESCACIAFIPRSSPRTPRDDSLSRWGKVFRYATWVLIPGESKAAS